MKNRKPRKLKKRLKNIDRQKSLYKLICELLYEKIHEDAVRLGLIKTKI